MHHRLYPPYRRPRFAVSFCGPTAARRCGALLAEDRPDASDHPRGGRGSENRVTCSSTAVEPLAPGPSQLRSVAVTDQACPRPARSRRHWSPSPGFWSV